MFKIKQDKNYPTLFFFYNDAIAIYNCKVNFANYLSVDNHVSMSIIIDTNNSYELMLYNTGKVIYKMCINGKNSWYTL